MDNLQVKMRFAMLPVFMNTSPESYENWHTGWRIMQITIISVNLLSEQFLTANM